ncbi:MAG: glucose-6-phosphate isomerase [Rhodobacteraceae bacterium]|nr:glucose-6-phosphate isomerase [Paracoccaceae bacterium]
MKTALTLVLCASFLATTGCDDLTRDEQILVGGLAGATIGIITARALLDDDDWVLLGALGGAAVGALVARNRATNECAYARRDGRYRITRCP